MELFRIGNYIFFPIFSAVFEPFLLAYIEKFKFCSLTTEEWKDFLYQYFTEKVKTLLIVGTFVCASFLSLQ